jgi:hypothetical protein
MVTCSCIIVLENVKETKMEWKQIRDSLYSVSTTGLVMSDRTGKLIKSRKDRYGYSIITLHSTLLGNTYKVHRLVAEVFIDNTYNKPTVNHKNSVRHDNNVSNLEWATMKENIAHAIEEGNLDNLKFFEARSKYHNSDKIRSIASTMGNKHKYKNLKQFNAGEK